MLKQVDKALIKAPIGTIRTDDDLINFNCNFLNLIAFHKKSISASFFYNKAKIETTFVPQSHFS